MDENTLEYPNEVTFLTKWVYKIYTSYDGDTEDDWDLIGEFDVNTSK